MIYDPTQMEMKNGRSWSLQFFGPRYKKNLSVFSGSEFIFDHLVPKMYQNILGSG